MGLLETLIEFLRDSRKPCIVEYKGKYWTGNGFGKKEKAKTFPNSDNAWEFVEDNFNQSMCEQIGVEHA